MSYINKRVRAFNNGPADEVVSIRSEGRMKNYPSAADIRAWSDTVEERRQHILEYIAKNKRGMCPDKLIPLDVLIDAMMAEKNARIEKLEKRIDYLEKLLDIYSQLDLTAEQKQKLDELKKDIKEAYAELDVLKSEKYDLETVYDRRKRKSDTSTAGKPKKRDKKRKGSEDMDPRRKAQRKKKSRVPAEEIPETSGDEQIPPPKKYKGKKKSEKIDESQPENLTVKPESSKKDKLLKTKPVAPATGALTGKKKRTSATAMKEKVVDGKTRKPVSEQSDEPHPVQEPLIEKTTKPVPKKQPISDTEYELNAEKSQKKGGVIPERKEKSDVSKPRSESPSSSQQIEKPDRGNPKEPTSKKIDKPSAHKKEPMDVEKETEGKKSKGLPEKSTNKKSMKKPQISQEETKTPSGGDETVPGSETKKVVSVPEKSNKLEQRVEDNTTKSKPQTIPQDKRNIQLENDEKNSKSETQKVVTGRKKAVPEKQSKAEEKLTKSDPHTISEERTPSEGDEIVAKSENKADIPTRKIAIPEKSVEVKQTTEHKATKSEPQVMSQEKTRTPAKGDERVPESKTEVDSEKTVPKKSAKLKPPVEDKATKSKPQVISPEKTKTSAEGDERIPESETEVDSEKTVPEKSSKSKLSVEDKATKSKPQVISPEKSKTPTEGEKRVTEPKTQVVSEKIVPGKAAKLKPPDEDKIAKSKQRISQEQSKTPAEDVSGETVPEKSAKLKKPAADKATKSEPQVNSQEKSGTQMEDDKRVPKSESRVVSKKTVPEKPAELHEPNVEDEPTKAKPKSFPEKKKEKSESNQPVIEKLDDGMKEIGNPLEKKEKGTDETKNVPQNVSVQEKTTKKIIPELGKLKESDLEQGERSEITSPADTESDEGKSQKRKERKGKPSDLDQKLGELKKDKSSTEKSEEVSKQPGVETSSKRLKREEPKQDQKPKKLKKLSEENENSGIPSKEPILDRGTEQDKMIKESLGKKPEVIEKISPELRNDDSRKTKDHVFEKPGGTSNKTHSDADDERTGKEIDSNLEASRLRDIEKVRNKELDQSNNIFDTPMEQDLPEIYGFDQSELEEIEQITDRIADSAEEIIEEDQIEAELKKLKEPQEKIVTAETIGKFVPERRQIQREPEISDRAVTSEEQKMPEKPEKESVTIEDSKIGPKKQEKQTKKEFDGEPTTPMETKLIPEKHKLSKKSEEVKVAEIERSPQREPLGESSTMMGTKAVPIRTGEEPVKNMGYTSTPQEEPTLVTLGPESTTLEEHESSQKPKKERTSRIEESQQSEPEIDNATIIDTKVVPLETTEKSEGIEKVILQDEQTPEEVLEPTTLKETKPIPEKHEISEELEGERISEIKESKQEEAKSPGISVDDEELSMLDGVEPKGKKKIAEKADELLDKVKSKISEKSVEPKSIVEGREEPDNLVPSEETEGEIKLSEYEYEKKEGLDTESAEAGPLRDEIIPKDLSTAGRSEGENLIGAKKAIDEDELGEPEDEKGRTSSMKTAGELEDARGERQPGDETIKESLKIFETVKEQEQDDKKGVKEEFENVVAEIPSGVKESSGIDLTKEKTPTTAGIPEDKLDRAWDVDHPKGKVDLQQRKDFQKGVPTQQLDHRCAALIRHAQERCAALASRTGGIVALPDSEKRKQDLIPTGYWPGEVFQEPIPPQSTSVVPDLTKERDDLPTEDAVMTGSLKQPIEKLEGHRVERATVDIDSTQEDSQLSKVPVADGLTGRQIQSTEPIPTVSEGSQPTERMKEQKYKPKLLLAWEEVDAEEPIEEDDKFAGKSFMGNRISRVLSGDTSGLGTSTFPVSFKGSKTLSGEILQRRLSENVLRKKSIEINEAQTTENKKTEQKSDRTEPAHQEKLRPCGATNTRQQVNLEDTKQEKHVCNAKLVDDTKQKEQEEVQTTGKKLPEKTEPIQEEQRPCGAMSTRQQVNSEDTKQEKHVCNAKLVDDTELKNQEEVQTTGEKSPEKTETIQEEQRPCGAMSTRQQVNLEDTKQDKAHVCSAIPPDETKLKTQQQLVKTESDLQEEDRPCSAIRETEQMPVEKQENPVFSAMLADKTELEEPTTSKRLSEQQQSGESHPILEEEWRPCSAMIARQKVTKLETKETLVENQERPKCSAMRAGATELDKQEEVDSYTKATSTRSEDNLKNIDAHEVSTSAVEPKPVIKLFERELYSDREDTSEEHIQEPSSEVEKDDEVTNEVQKSIPDDEDVNQDKDIHHKESDHSVEILTTNVCDDVIPLQENCEFVSAIDTSKMKDDEVLVKTLKNKLPPDMYEVRRSLENVDLHVEFEIANKDADKKLHSPEESTVGDILSIEEAGDESQEQNLIIRSISDEIVNTEDERDEPQETHSIEQNTAGEKSQELDLIEESTAVGKEVERDESRKPDSIEESSACDKSLEIADEEVERDESQSQTELIDIVRMDANNTVVNTPETVTFIPAGLTGDIPIVGVPKLELDITLTPRNMIGVVAGAATMENISKVDSVDDFRNFNETHIVQSIIEDVMKKVSEIKVRDDQTDLDISAIIGDSSACCVNVFEDLNKPSNEEIKMDSMKELFHAVNERYIPRAHTLKDSSELIKIQTDKSIVEDDSCKPITENLIPRATTVETTTITEEMLGKVSADEVLTPAQINKILNDRLSLSPNAPPSPVPQVAPEAFTTVPRAVMQDFVPTPVPVYRSFLPRFFGTRRSLPPSLRHDSVSQTEAEIKRIINADTLCPVTELVCDCCKKAVTKTQSVCKGVYADVKSEPVKESCRNACSKRPKDVHVRGNVLRGEEDKQEFERNQDGLEKLMISITPKDHKEDLPTLIIHKDAEIIALRNALAAKESYCAEQRKIAAAALEQLENIKNIVEERDDLRKKLETSQDELEELRRNIALGYPFGISDTRPSMPTLFDKSQHATCEEEITALENEINDMRSGKLTPDLEAQVIRKEVEVLKKYCSKLSIIQKENHQLKNQIAKYEDRLNRLGCLESDDRIEDLKDKLNTLSMTMKERDELKCKCDKLEKELMSYNDLPEDIEVFKQRSLLLDEVLQDRDRLSKRVEQLRGVDEELYNLRKKSCRVDELEENLKKLSKDKKFQEEELEHLRCKCSFAEIEALNQKAEGDTLKSKISCLEHEVECMKCLCKDKERLKQERDDLQRNLDELIRMQNNFDYMKNQMKCLDVLKKEKDLYKTKYENLMGLECECDILRAQVERAKVIEKERNALENQVEDLENCIADQENEIRRLVCHIDILAKGRDEQQEKIKDVLCTMRSELDKKDNIIKSSEEKLSIVQKELITSIQGLSSETTNLKSKNDNLDKCICNLQKERTILEGERDDLKNYLSQLEKERNGFEEDKKNLESCLCNLEMTVKTSSEEQSLMKVQMAKMKEDAEDLNKQIKELTCDNEFLIEKLQEREAHIKSLEDVLKDHEPMLQNLEILKQTARADSVKYELETAKFQQQTSLTGDEHLHELLRQSKHAVQKIALELCKQYEEWDCVKNKLKQIKKRDLPKGKNTKCTCGTSRLKDSSTQDRSGNDKDVNVKIMETSATQDEGVVKYDKTISAKGLDTAETQYPKEYGVASEDHTKWDCFEKKDNQEKENVDARLPSICKCVGTTYEEEEGQVMKLDKKVGKTCECVSIGTDYLPDESRDIKKISDPTFQFDVSKQSSKAKPDIDSDGKTDEISEDSTDKYEYDVSKWSCKQPKPEGQKTEEDNEDEMHTARSTEDKCKHLEDRIEILEKELAQANETILNLQEKLTSTDRTFAENQALRRHSSEVQEVAKDQIEDLVEHLKRAKERAAFLEEENDKLNNSLRNVQLEKDELMKIIKDLQDGKEGNIGDILAKLRNDLDDCLNEKSVLQERIAKLGKQLDIPDDKKLREILTAKKSDEPLSHEMNLQQKRERDNEALNKTVKELDTFLPEMRLLGAEDNLKTERESQLEVENRNDGLLKPKYRKVDTEEGELKLEGFQRQLKYTPDNLERESEERQKDGDEIAELASAGDKKLIDREDELKLEDFKEQPKYAPDRQRDENKIADLLEDQGRKIDSTEDGLEMEDLKKQLKDALDNLKRESEEKQKAENKITELLKAGDSDLDKLRQKELEDLMKKLHDAEDKLKLTGDTGEIDRIRKELADEKSKSKSLDNQMSQIQKLKQEKDDLEKMLASNVLTTSRRSSSMESEREALAKENKKLEDENIKLRQFENDNNDLIQKLSSFKDENKKLKDDLELAKSELEKLKKQKPDSDIIDTLRKENENLLKKLEAQAKEISDLLDKMRTPKPVVDISKSQLDREMKEKQTLQSIIADLENQLKNISKDEKKVQPILPSDNLQKMIEDLTKRLEEEQKRAEVAELALRNMKTSDPSAMLKAEIAKLEKQLKDIEGENVGLKQQLLQGDNGTIKLKTELDTALDEAKKINEENAQSKQRISDLQKENNDLKSMIDKLKSGLSGDDFLKSEAKESKDQIVQLEKDKASLRNEIAQKDNEMKNAYDKIAKLQDENSELKRNQVKLEGDNDKMKKDLDNALNNAKKDAARISQLENENSKLRKDIQNLEGELAKLKRDLDSTLNTARKETTGVSDLQDEINKLKQKCNQLENENGNLKKDLNEALDNSKTTAAKLKQLADDFDKLKNAKDTAESKLEKLKKDLDTANAEVKKAAIDSGHQLNEVASMREKLAKLEAENTKLKKDLSAGSEDTKKSPGFTDQDANLKQKLAQLENENSKLKKDIDKALDDAKKSSAPVKLKDEENKVREKIVNVEAENSKLSKDLSASLDKLNKATDTITQLQDSQNKLKQNMSSLESDNAQLKKDLNRSLDDAKKYVSEISNLRDSESKLKQRVAQLESENTKLKKDLDDTVDSVKNNLNMNQSLKDENNKLAQKLAQLEQENVKLKKDLEQALNDKKLPTPVDESEKLKAKLSQLEDTNSKLKKELDNVLEDHKKCSKTISQLQDEIERLKKKIAELEKDSSKLKLDYEGAMGDVKSSKDELNKLKESELKLKQLLAQVQTDNDKLNKDITVLTAELKTTATNLAAAKDEVVKAKQKNGILEGENTQLKKNSDGTLDELQKLQKSLSQLQEENPKLKQRIALLETENAKLKKELDAAIADAKKGSAGADQIRSEDTKLRDLLAQLERDNKKLKDDLNNALDQAKRSVADVTKMRDDDSKQKQQIAKLENENAKLKKDLEKAINDALVNSSGAQGLRDENNKLKQKINQLEGEIAKLKADLNAALENAKKGASGLTQMQEDDAKLKQRISQLEKDNAKLKNDLETALNEAKAGNDTGTKLRNENTKQKQMIGQLEDEIAKLKKNLENAVNDTKKGDSGLSNMQDENAKLKQKIGQLEKENITLKKSLDDTLANGKTASSINAQMSEENNKLKQRVKQLESDLDKLRKDLNTALDDKKKALDNLTAARDGETKSKQRLAELESTNMKLKQDLDTVAGDAKSGKSDLNKFRDENSSMKQRTVQLEGDNSKLKKELDSVLNDSKNKNAEVQRLKDENAKLKQKIADLEISNSNLKKELDSALSDSKNAAIDFTKLKEEIAKHKQASAQKDSQLTDLKKQLDVSKDKGSRSTELAMENDKLKGRIKDLENQLAKSGDDLTKLKREVLQKDGQINELKGNLENIAAENKDKNSRIKSLENKVEQQGSLDDSLVKIRQEMSSREKEVNDMKNNLEKAMSDNKDKDAKIKETVNENEKLKARLKDLENQLGKLNDNLKVANAVAKKAAEDLSKMKGDYNKLKTDNEVLMKDKASVNDVKGYESKIEQLSAELSKQKKECTDNIASMKEQFDRDMKDLLRKNEASIAKLQKAHEEFLRELNEKQDKDIDSLQNALRKAKVDLDEVTKERDRLKALLNDQRRKSIEIKDKVEQVESIVKKERRKSREESQRSKDLESKLDAEIRRSKDLESMSFVLKKSIEEQKRKSEELVKEKELIQKKTDKLEKEKENLQRSSLEIQKAFEDEKRKSVEVTKDLEQLKKKISEVTTPAEEKKKKTIEPVSIDKSKEPLKMQTFKTLSIDATMPDVITITSPLSEKELKFFGQSCSCEPNWNTVLEKLTKFGIDGLGIDELQLLHSKISDATANILAKTGQSSGVLKPNENDKLGLLRRIASLEGDLLKKQKHAQQKVIAMQYAVKLEKERLSDLRKSLDEEKLKNSELLSQIGSQSKVVSNIQEERDLIQRQKSYHEQKLEQYLIAVEEERGKSRNLEDELEKEKSNNQHLKSLLEAERNRSRQNKRKDTEALEAMRIKLEKTVNSEMMLRMKLQEKTCHRHPSPHCTPVRDGQQICHPRPTCSRTRTAFYTDLSPGECSSRAYPKRTFSSHSGGRSGSSNGLDLEDK